MLEKVIVFSSLGIILFIGLNNIKNIFISEKTFSKLQNKY